MCDIKRSFFKTLSFPFLYNKPKVKSDLTVEFLNLAAFFFSFFADWTAEIGEGLQPLFTLAIAKREGGV